MYVIIEHSGYYDAADSYPLFLVNTEDEAKAALELINEYQDWLKEHNAKGQELQRKLDQNRRLTPHEKNKAFYYHNLNNPEKFKKLQKLGVSKTYDDAGYSYEEISLVDIHNL